MDFKKIAFDSAIKHEVVKDDEELLLVVCNVTKEELFYCSINSENIYPFNSFGFCFTCKNPFHESHLHGYEWSGKSDWPVQYIGKYCKDCYSKMDEEVALTEDEKKELNKEIEE